VSKADEVDERHANEVLGFVEQACDAAGVGCSRRVLASDVIYEAILAAAADAECDLIFMASHGKSGLGAVLLGSETIKVLTHSRIPVLVCR
jgi:nucleotide-binding universal stress UspA family protein